MATTISTKITIKTRPERIWEILTDLDRYSKWNPFIRSIQGILNPGQHIKVHILPPDSKGMHFRPKITAVVPNQLLSWLGTLWLGGLFDGAHRFELTDNRDGSTTFVHSETFKGILVPFLKGQLKQTEKGFELMNQALKERAESSET
ncbi:SRPBCC domain-containing protein [Taibaiella sp. KBW10]|uniref:SRPBCC domain-containing protein n=1 Tax=Taibaiella sp. KBW10 TaxID=2153357 RepID=UPI000F5AAE9E|nr:SRPBCC domain-containing protein [Taibaiella sp. KBW10]RQO30655.1 SRPBCC domain-containing protein [Taibaiella sp. KBW10]